MDSVVPTISNEHLDLLASLHDPSQVRRQLISIFVQRGDDGQREVAGDFYFYAYALGLQQKFDFLKLSTFLTICQRVFEDDISTNDPKLTVTDSFKKFESLLLKHSVERPPVSIGIFDDDDVKYIVEDMLNNYYRHWKIYKACFTNRIEPRFSQHAPFFKEEEDTSLPNHKLLCRPLSLATPIVHTCLNENEDDRLCAVSNDGLAATSAAS